MKAHCMFLPLTALSPALCFWPICAPPLSAAKIGPRALALETGRLDDVFGALTGKARPAAAPFHANGMENDKGAAS